MVPSNERTYPARTGGGNITTEEPRGPGGFAADRATAVAVLTGPDLAHIVDLVAWTDSGWLHVANSAGEARVASADPGGPWDVLRGRSPVARQDPLHAIPLGAALADPSPPNDRNSYPLAGPRLASVFADPSRSPDLVVVHTPGHHWPDQGGHLGEHGSLDAGQSRAPLLLAGAGVRARGRLARHARVIDVGPTLAALAGAAMPDAEGSVLADLLDPSITGLPITGLPSARPVPTTAVPTGAVPTGAVPTGAVSTGAVSTGAVSTGAVRPGAVVVGPATAGPRLPRHVVGLLWDGTNCNDLLDLARDGRLPNVARLLARGCALTGGSVAEFPSVTLTNHTSAITGLGPGRHGILHNVYFDRAIGRQVSPNEVRTWHTACEQLRPGVRTMFEAVAAARPGAYTACVNEPIDRGATYSTFELVRALARLDGPGGMADHLPPAQDDPHASATWVEADADYAWSSRVDALGLTQILDLWKAEPPLLTWWNTTVTDTGHHLGGPYSPAARASMLDADRRLGVFLDLLDARGLTDQTAILLTADHGSEGAREDCTGDWDAALLGAGVTFRDEGYGFLYLGDLGIESSGSLVDVDSVVGADEAAGPEGAADAEGAAAPSPLIPPQVP